TRRFGGLGLGLTISKALTEQHGGKLSAVSDGQDKGATFCLELPLLLPEKTSGPKNSSSQNGPAARQSQSERTQERVLLLEDNADTSRVLQVLLERNGLTVLVARSAQAALEIAKTYPCDILISDIRLPDGSGLDVLKQLNAIRPT